MSQPGFSVMLGYLSGNEDSVNAFTKSQGKVITSISQTRDNPDDYRGGEDALFLTLEDGSILRLADEGQSCCESRYMTVEDDLSYYVGSRLLDAEVKEGPEEVGEYDETHEIAFLHVKTDKGTFVVSTHNEHNGYYGGFLLRASIVKAADE